MANSCGIVLTGTTCCPLYLDGIFEHSPLLHLEHSARLQLPCPRKSSGDLISTDLCESTLQDSVCRLVVTGWSISHSEDDKNCEIISDPGALGYRWYFSTRESPTILHNKGPKQYSLLWWHSMYGSATGNSDGLILSEAEEYNTHTFKLAVHTHRHAHTYQKQNTAVR